MFKLIIVHMQLLLAHHNSRSCNTTQDLHSLIKKGYDTLCAKILSNQLTLHELIVYNINFQDGEQTAQMVCSSPNVIYVYIVI